MVAQPVAHDPRIKVVTEIRGAASKIWSDAKGEIVIAGPAGTGKTRAILEWIHYRCSRERVRVLMLRKTLESLKTAALVTYTEQVLHDFDGSSSPADGVSYFGGNRIRPAQFTYEETGSIIVLGGLDSAQKLKSTEYDIIYVNEATELTLDEWESLMYRTNRPKMGVLPAAAVIIGDCNPDAPTHWIRQREQEGKLKFWVSYHEDNPAMWDRHAKEWTPSGQLYIDTLDSLTGVRKQRLRYGKWVSAEGQVYDEWNDATHLVDREAVADRLLNAWHFGVADWGWTNPGVLQVWAVDDDGRIVRVAEYFHTRRPVDGWWIPRANELSERFRFYTWVCDPAEPQYIEQFRAAGLDAVKAANDLLPGINAVQDRLVVAGDGLPRLQFVRDALIERDEELVQAKQPFCTEQEIPMYVWAKNAGGQSLKDKPVDAFNHGLDCTRYAALYMANRIKPQIWL